MFSLIPYSLSAILLLRIHENFGIFYTTEIILILLIVFFYFLKKSLDKNREEKIQYPARYTDFHYKTHKIPEKIVDKEYVSEGEDLFFTEERKFYLTSPKRYDRSVFQPENYRVRQRNAYNKNDFHRNRFTYSEFKPSPSKDEFF